MSVLDKLNPFREEKDSKVNTEGQHPIDAAPRGDSGTSAPTLTTADGPECSVCGEPGADKKWAGQAFHKKCLRKARKMAKRMF